MRILVISHNVFDYTTSMGKTLSKLFEKMQGVELAQLYIHNEEPCRTDVCDKYFRITDKEILKSIVIRRTIGAEFDKKDVKESELYLETDSFEHKIYQKGRKRTPIIYLARDFAWDIGNWNNKKLHNWVNHFDPDIIFLASGDYSCIYKIAFKIATTLNKPLVTMCFDDYYLYNRNRDSVLGRIRQNSFMRIVRKTIDKSDFLITVCDQMSESYSKLFNKECHTLYTPAEKAELQFVSDAKSIAYFGSLGLGRHKQLVEIGKALLACNSGNKPKYIDVYSSESREEILRLMTPENGICMHKAVSQEEMKNILTRCIAVIHTESFDPTISERTKYSLSTKIAESMAFGPCLFGYGPANIASMRYLIKNESAIVATSNEELIEKLTDVIDNKELRTKTIENARATADKNHDINVNNSRLFHWLQKAISSNKGRVK